MKAALSFLNTYSESKVLSAPRTVTLDNEAANIEVGTMFPIVNIDRRHRQYDRRLQSPTRT